jgi:hypothetical protein
MLTSPTIFNRLAVAAAFVVAGFAIQTLPAAAQGKPRPAQQQKQAPPEETEVEQVQLSQAQIDSFITAENALKPITAKLKGEPNKQQMSQMEAVVKQNGFKDFDEYGDVGSNLGMVFSGIDPQTKKYDPQAMLKQEVDRVNADKKIPAQQKKRILADLQKTSGSIPALKYPGNADLVVQNYDKLKPLMDDDQPPPQQQKQPQQQRPRR